MHENRFHKRVIFLIAYLLFAILPVYWICLLYTSPSPRD